MGHIAVLAQLSLRAPDAFEQKSDVIMEFLVRQVLRSNEDEDMVCAPLYLASCNR